MDAVCFVVRIRRDNGKWDKGVEVKTAETKEGSINAALQSYHAYLGAYAYGHVETVDYVECSVIDENGAAIACEVWRA